MDKKPKKTELAEMSLLDEKGIRKVKGEWYYAIEDIIAALSSLDKHNSYVKLINSEVITKEVVDIEIEIQDESTLVEEQKLSKFNEKLKKGLNWNPKE